MAGAITYFVLNNKILSSHLKQLIQHINSTNHNIHYFDQIIKVDVNLGDNKGVSNYDSYSELIDLQNTLLMIVFDTPEKDVSNSKIIPLQVK